MKSILIRIALIVLCSVLISPSHAQTVDSIAPDLRARIDRIATQVLQQTGVPSASISIVQHGKIVYTQAYGKARLEPAEAATPAMRYSIGSIQSSSPQRPF